MNGTSQTLGQGRLHSAAVILCVLIHFLSISSVPVHAQSDADGVKADLERIQRENEALRQQLRQQTETVDALIKRIDLLEATSLKSEQTIGDDFPAFDPEDLEVEPASSWLNFQLFGDVNYRVGGAADVDGNRLPNTFSLGQLDLLATAQISERFSVLSEIVFQYNAQNGASTTIERLQLQYNATDLFNFRLGRTHTPFGYWNETYHHGTWFQTTIQRPELLRFHDGGSILPIHSVGVEMFGYQPFDPLDIHYNLGVANGRGRTPHETLSVQDLNGNKALYGVFSLAPGPVPGLRFGVNTYYDLIPPNNTTGMLRNELDELILGGHIIYLRNRVEFLSEADHVRHRDEIAGQTYDSWGVYAQAGYQIGPVKPYVRYDYLDIDENDPFYGPTFVDQNRYTVGIRWDPIDWAAFKIEYQYIDTSNLNNPNAFYTQATFTY